MIVRGEIKFRAWETKEKRMVLNGQFDIHLYGEGNYGISHHFFDESERQYRFTCCKRNNWDRTKPEVILMQWTGLKDKNGGDIYEGDIVACMSFGILKRKPLKPYFIVKWDSQRGRFEACHIDIGYYLNTEYVVIGNIFQNPELLKDVRR